jgi:hypothetical protein
MLFIQVFIKNFQFTSKLFIIMAPNETLLTFQFVQCTLLDFQFFSIGEKEPNTLILKGSPHKHL